MRSMKRRAARRAVAAVGNVPARIGEFGALSILPTASGFALSGRRTRYLLHRGCPAGSAAAAGRSARPMIATGPSVKPSPRRSGSSGDHAVDQKVSSRRTSRARRPSGRGAIRRVLADPEMPLRRRRALARRFQPHRAFSKGIERIGAGRPAFSSTTARPPPPGSFAIARMPYRRRWRTGAAERPPFRKGLPCAAAGVNSTSPPRIVCPRLELGGDAARQAADRRERRDAEEQADRERRSRRYAVARSRARSARARASGRFRPPALDLPVVHHDDAVAMLGEFGVVGDDEQRRAGRSGARRSVPMIACARRGVEIARRLVGKDDRGPSWPLRARSRRAAVRRPTIALDDASGEDARRPTASSSAAARPKVIGDPRELQRHRDIFQRRHRRQQGKGMARCRSAPAPCARARSSWSIVAKSSLARGCLAIGALALPAPPSASFCPIPMCPEQRDRSAQQTSRSTPRKISTAGLVASERERHIRGAAIARSGEGRGASVKKGPLK